MAPETKKEKEDAEKEIEKLNADLEPIMRELGVENK